MSKEVERKVFLDELPHGGKFIPKDKVNWKESVGYKIRFVYDDIEGELEIIDYNRETEKLSLIYLNNDIFEITPHHLKKCQLKELLGLKTVKYKYNIGSIINTNNGEIKIINQIRIGTNSNTRINRTDKGYEYECVQCGNKDSILESHIIEGKGCNVCSNQKVVKGINDIATTHPHLIKYFVNIEDAYTYTFGSNKYINVICNECGTTKTIRLCDLYRHGLSCPKCGDGVPYTEKIMYSILEQLKIDFKKGTTFNWSQDKIYDFYIPSLNCIIETHGMQHYEETYIGRGKGRCLKEEQENDRLKERLARENGVEHYMIIDCRKSELKYIKNNILNSRLTKLFDLSIIDWLKCEEFACSSLVRKACDIWNDGVKDITRIATIMRMSYSAAFTYIKQGLKLNWCNYKTKTERKNIKIHKACELWNSGIKNTTDIGNLLNIDSSVILIYLYKGVKLGICDYTPEESRYIESIKRSKSIQCLENGMIFKSAKEIEKKSLEIFGLKLMACTIREVCNGKYKNKHYKGFTFKYVD